MHYIIVPTDFSVKSYNALILAKSIARKTNASICLIHVIEPIPDKLTSVGELKGDVMDDVYVVELVEKLTKELEAIKKANSDEELKIKTEIHVGDPTREIRHAIKRLNADMVIIGAKGITDAEEYFLGSISDKVIRSVPCPVITVKESMESHEFQNIVYATDLEEEHEPLINFIKQLQRLYGSTIHIVRINTPKDFENEIDTKVGLRKLVDKHNFTNYTMNSYGHEDKEYGIVYFADEKKADLIAMGVHEKSEFHRLVSGGSLASEVTDHTFRPILTNIFKKE